MSSTSTSWTTQGNTKAGATSTSSDSLTTGTLTADTIQLASNIIKASDGGSTITLDTSDNVTIAGDLTVSGNDIKGTGGTAITMDGSNNVTIAGDLTISGGNITSALTCDSTFTSTGAATLSSTLAVTGVISPTTHIDMPDSANIKLGTGDDFQLYHDGSNSYITNSTGALKLATESSGIAVSIGHTTSETTINDNLTVTGTITLGNSEVMFQPADDIIRLISNDASMSLQVATGTADVDASVVFMEGATPKWYIANDAADAKVVDLFTIGTTATIGSNVILGLDTDSVVSLSTIDAGTSNTIFGKNAGDSIQSGGNYNTLFGEDAGTALTTGDDNVIIGYDAGVAMTTTTKTVLIGYQAGTAIDNADGEGIVSIGYQALAANEDGASNIAIGYLALTTNVDGDRQTAIGELALRYSEPSSGGGRNTAFGYRAGLYVSTGGNNVFVGSSAGQGITGTRLTGEGNTAIGYQAGLLFQGAAESNTVVGDSAGDAITTGIRNTLIGKNAGTVTTGNYNTLVGYAAGDGVSTGEENTGLGASIAFDVDANNQTAIGFEATTDSANDIAIGNTSVDEVKGQVDFSTFSDERTKTDIKDSNIGLDFINLLKPRKFKKVCPAEYPDSIRKLNDENAIWNDAQENKIWDGLIAQEVKSAMDSCGITFSGWNEESNSKQLLTYSALVMPLIKAVQELSKKVKELEN